jgi:hypothetical protein
MPDNMLKVGDVLSAEECAAVDAFCGERRGATALPEVSAFLKEKFGVRLETEPDIVIGFAADSSTPVSTGRASASAPTSCAATGRGRSRRSAAARPPWTRKCFSTAATSSRSEL